MCRACLLPNANTRDYFSAIVAPSLFVTYILVNDSVLAVFAFSQETTLTTSFVIDVSHGMLGLIGSRSTY